MASDWLNHQALMIIKGVGKTPTDNFSADSDPIPLNLMSEPITLMDWTPQIPQVKNGGVWTDSPISDGRLLLAAPVGNVIETMTVLVADSTRQNVMKQMDAISQMIADCRDFSQSQYQIEPVYLMWFASCGAGPQYALLFDIEMSPQFMASDKPTIQVTLTLEREPYWRGIPPGANPKLWTFYFNGQQIGLNKTLADATLLTGSDHLVNASIRNKYEWTPAATGSHLTAISQNFITIPAASVPGDAPALLEFEADYDVTLADLYIGHTTKKLSGIGHDGTNHGVALNLNVGDSLAGSLVKTVGNVSNAVLSNNSSVNFTYGARTVTGIDGAYVTACSWGLDSFGNQVALDRQLYRGTYAIFVRAVNLSAVTPVLTDMKMRILIDEVENTATSAIYQNRYTSPELNVPIAVTSPLIIYPLSYVGTISIPFSTRSVQSMLGYGTQLESQSGANPNNLRITLQQQVLVATANRTFVALDVILMPVDEGLSQIVFSVNAFGSTGTIIYDNTGYISKGDSNPICVGYQNATSTLSGGIGQEVRGQSIYLKPRTDQRLYFMADTSGLIAAPSPTGNIRLNIVPRWSSIRDA